MADAKHKDNGNGGKPNPFVFKCTATSNYPVYEASWGIELEDEVEFAFYQNLAADLTAALYAKLGQEFSKFRLDNDSSRLNAEVQKLSKALGGSILD